MHRGQTRHKHETRGLGSGAWEPSETVWKRWGVCTCIFLRFHQILQSVRNSPPSRQLSVRSTRQPSHSAGGAQHTASQGTISLYWRGTQGNFVLDLTPTLLTGHQTALVSFYHPGWEASSPGTQDSAPWPMDNQQGVPGGWLREGLSAEWVCPRQGGLIQGLCTTLGIYHNRA